MRNILRKFCAALTAVLFVVVLASCGHHHHDVDGDATTTTTTTEVVPSVTNVGHVESIATPPIAPRVEKQPDKPKPVESVPAEHVDRKPIRIQAGSVINWRDKQGHEWLADAGFSDGAMLNRGDVKIEGTENPDLYKSERTNMEKFTWPVPNGKYTVKLHFAENIEDVKKEGERVFSVDVMGQKFVNLDIFKEAGGANKALIKSAKINVTKGKIEINFVKTEQKEPLINGIEILPE